jgi:hypothetical protein
LVISEIRHFRRTVAPIQILNIPFDTTPGKLCKLLEENVYSSLVYVNAAMAHKNIEEEVDEKLKLADLVLWQRHYQNRSDNL